MTKRHINFGSIEQFRNVQTNITRQSQYIGLDADGVVTYNPAAKLPIVKVTATEKIHGTNAAVCFNNVDGLWVQSRENIITTEKDNAGCAFNAEQNADQWLDIIQANAKARNINLDTHTISMFFEWCGGGIQKNSAASDLSKRAVIFQHFKVSPIEPSENEVNTWHEVDYLASGPLNNIYNIYYIMEFPHWTFEIDFNNSAPTINKIIELVDKIESSSPFGTEFGKSENIGEGVVCTFNYEGTLYRFKVKGEKHSNSKVKTLKPVDEAVEQAKIDFANYATPAWRLEQAWQKVFGINNELAAPDIKLIGSFLREVMADIVKEESDIMAQKGLEPKLIANRVNQVAKGWFVEQLNTL